MSITRLLGVTVSASLCLAVSGALPLAAQASDPAAASDALASAREQAARARERSAELEREARAASAASTRATLAAASLAARVQQAEASVAAAQASLVLVGQRRQRLQQRLDRERAPLVGLMAGLHTMASRPPVLALLQPGSIEDTVRLRAVVAAITPQVHARTQSLRTAVVEARALEADARALAKQRSATQADLEQRRFELAAASETERLRARRASGAADQEAARAYAIGEQARSLSSLVQRLRAARQPQVAAPAAPGPVAGKTLFRAPVAGIPDAGQSSSSAALTYLAAPGALVVAPAAGRIAFAGPYRGYGRIVIVEHPGGWTSLLTGLGAVQVAVGQAVVAGSPLGQADARDPTVSFELRRGGARVAARDYVR